jgi:hypothetical protein
MLSSTYQPERPRLVSVDEGRQLLGGLSRTGIFRLMRLGAIERVKIGNRAFITVSSIDAYLDMLSEDPGADRGSLERQLEDMQAGVA